MSAPGGGRRAPSWKGLLGIAVSLVFLWWALRDADAGKVIHEIRQADPLWLFLATILATGTIAVRAWRWKPILRPVLATSRFRSRFAATFIRFAVNNIVPARVGEFAGAYSLSRMERISASASFGSLVVERVLDALVVVSMLFAAVALPGFPTEQLSGSSIVGRAWIVLLAVVVVAVGLLAAVMWPDFAVRTADRLSRPVLPAGVQRRLVDALRAFLEGVSSLRSPALLIQAVLASIVVWLVSALSFYFALLAFRIQVPLLPASLFLQAIIALAVAVPSAPGFFGLFEGAARFGLVGLWGVGVNKAVGFAISMHIIGFVPVTLIGLYYMSSLGLSLREVESTEEIVEEQIEAEDSRHGGAGDEPGPPADDRLGGRPDTSA